MMGGEFSKMVWCTSAFLHCPHVTSQLKKKISIFLCDQELELS